MIAKDDPINTHIIFFLSDKYCGRKAKKVVIIAWEMFFRNKI